MRLASLAIAVAALSACASSPLPTDKTTVVPADRVYDSRFSTPSSGSGHIVVKRDAGYFGVDCTNFLAVDGIKIAQVEPSERIELFLSLEEHIIAISRASSCGSEIKELAVTPDADATKTFRISVGPNGLLEFQRTAL